MFKAAGEHKPGTMDRTDFLNNLLVVIVLYGKKPEESASFNSLLAMLNGVVSIPGIFVYDNSPQQAAVSDDYIVYFHDPRNSGVSHAYNQASEHARKTSKNWMLFLDQDTRLESDLFEKMARATEEYRTSVVFVPRIKDTKGLLSPFYFRIGRGRRMRDCPASLPLDKHRFINSGLLIRHAAFVAAGGYDEGIPLDFSDICFGERLRRQNVTDHFVVVDADLEHTFSDNEEITVEKALNRFRLFRKGAFAMGKHSTAATFVYRVNTFLRACRLCLKYRDPRFVILFIQADHD